MVQYLVSTTMLPRAIGKDFTDYTAIPMVISQLEVDGVELVFLPEWDTRFAPITKTSADWDSCQKISVSDIANWIKQHQINVPSVHLNRDIGNLLCSNDLTLIKRGEKILEENLAAASTLKTEVVVLHLWDTYKNKIDIIELYNRVYEICKTYSLKLTIENIPLSDQTITTLQAWSILKKLMPDHYGFTLDLNWCSLYDNFEELLSMIKSIHNIHVQGYVNHHLNIIEPRVGNLDLMSSISRLKNLNYNKYITLELSKAADLSDFTQALKLIRRQFE
ncbi:sugar phosphate isomerase/epimerase family protein [Haloplasma contractile]|uniref:Xylose isomerase domain-containing protein n=1 Tax=Haloplasma contractile SSD-17B TaxID=1033810 RepID=U2E744_9MOLU|nr:TIM barrel protein [Haloplasma contractile]ERJ11013.1 xylose isomerase domain-containing protein [Haloplasma contractile SSD-17B]